MPKPKNTVDSGGLSKLSVGASCNSEGGKMTDLFFSTNEDDVNAAKAICYGCPVVSLCLEVAIRNREDYGIWGGTDPEQRRRIIRRSSVQRGLGSSAQQVHT